MVFWRKKKQPPVVACYGKLPATGDFIRHNATSPESAAYDNWLASAVHTARESMGDHFDGCYQPACGVFIYRGDDGDDGDEPERGMVGVWAASGDSAGRRYPMTVSTCYDYEEMLAVGPALPLAVWPFIASAYELAAGSRNMQVDAFLGQVQQLQAVPLEQPETAAAGYQAWLKGQSMKAFWETVMGTVDSRFSVMSQIDLTIEIFRGQERPQTALALRLPLNGGDAYAAAVWMDITLRLAKWERTVLNAFWTPQHDLMLHLGPPQSGTFRELISSGTDADQVTDLITMQHADEATTRGRLSAPVAEAVANVNQTIFAFLQAL